jgi:hypothetical protein
VAAEGRPKFQECPIPRALPGIKPNHWIEQGYIKWTARIKTGKVIMVWQVLTHVWRDIIIISLSYMCKNLLYMRFEYACT